MSTLQRISISSLRGVPSRPIDSSHVAAIAESFEAVDQLVPITVDRDTRETVDGYHRTAAAISLGWSSIDAYVVDVEGAKRVIAEVDSNLCRKDLDHLARGEWLSKRKAAYEELHPETRAGVAGAVAKRVSATDSASVADATVRDRSVSSFADETARDLGLSARTIRRAVATAEKLTEGAKSVLRGTRAARSPKKLATVAAFPKSKQVKAAKKMVAGKKIVAPDREPGADEDVVPLRQEKVRAAIASLVAQTGKWQRAFHEAASAIVASDAAAIAANAPTYAAVFQARLGAKIEANGISSQRHGSVADERVQTHLAAMDEIADRLHLLAPDHRCGKCGGGGCSLCGGLGFVIRADRAQVAGRE